MTGTNGKTTTVELLGAIWRAAGMPVAVAGNVGTPLASLVGAVDPGATVICEASSFQLEDASAFAPECAVLLNVEPDHLDRHGTLDALPRGQAEDLRQPAPGRRGVIRPEDLAGAPTRRPAGGASACAARTTARTRGGAAGRADAMGVPRERGSPRRCATFAGVPTGWRRWPRPAACCT